jgi:hypothetical protein
LLGTLLALLLAVTPPPSPTAVAKKSALLGLAVNLPDSATPAERQKALEEVRRAGVSVFALELYWPAAERRPGHYDVAAVTRTARLLRQSGAVLHLDLPLVAGRTRVVRPDLADVPFDDPRLSLALGRMLDALGPALLDFSTLSLGNEADAYFADKPVELAAYRSLFAGAVEFLRRKAPRLLVGVATAAPTDSSAPVVAAALHQKSPVLFYLYAPFARGAPFTHRPPDTLDRDWKAILTAAAGRPVAFTEVSFSSAAENGSSPAKQAEFVRRMRRFLESEDGAQLLFARYVPWRDPPPGSSATLTPGPLTRERERGQPSAVEGSPGVDRRSAFFENRGLQAFDGVPKPAWRELVRSPRR